MGVFDRRVDGDTLSFTVDDAGDFIDEQTGAVWKILGEGVVRPPAGEQLAQVQRT